MIENLYRDYHDQLLWYCINLTSNNRALAEDLVQDAFIRALENAHILNELTRPQCRSWLYKTVKNLFIDRMRRINKEPIPQLDLITEDDLSEVMVRQLCGQLQVEERELFWLRYMEGYNSTELGKMYDLPASTVRARLLSARKKISRLYLEQKGKGE